MQGPCLSLVLGASGDGSPWRDCEVDFPDSPPLPLCSICLFNPSHYPGPSLGSAPLLSSKCDPAPLIEGGGPAKPGCCSEEAPSPRCPPSPVLQPPQGVGTRDPPFPPMLEELPGRVTTPGENPGTKNPVPAGVSQTGPRTPTV